MANNKADAATAVGIATCLYMMTTPAAPVGILGIPVLLLARAFRSHRDKQEDKERERKRIETRKEGDIMPLLPDVFLPRSSGILPRHYGSYNFDSDIYPSAPKNPLTALSEISPRLAHDVLITRCLTEAHQNIVRGPAEEFARQGKGMIATTTRRKGIFLNSDSVTTIIKPL